MITKISNPELADKIIKMMLDTDEGTSDIIANRLQEDPKEVKELMELLQSTYPNDFSGSKTLSPYNVVTHILFKQQPQWREFIRNGGFVAQEREVSAQKEQEKSDQELDRTYKLEAIRRSRNAQKISIISLIVAVLAMLISLFKK